MNAGVLFLANCQISGNLNFAGNGGGVHNTGTLVLTNVVVMNNSATGDGGGIWNSGTLIISGGSILENYAAGNGGGIENAAGGSVVATGTIIGETHQKYVPYCWITAHSGNVAGGNGGGVDNAGVLSLSTTSIDGNCASLDGGGLYQAGTADLEQDAVAFNGAKVRGEGIEQNAGSVALTNDTLAANSSFRPKLGASTYAQGGAIDVSGGVASLLFDTVADNRANTAGGIDNPSGSVSVQNTIVVRNKLANNAPKNCAGSISSSDYNLEDANTCSFASLHDQINVAAPVVSGLGSHGGPTLTESLTPTSPALDKIPPGPGCPVTVDQTGIHFQAQRRGM